MTPDQLDRLQLAITNMVLLDDGEDPITLAQLQAENAKDPAEAAEQRAKVAKLVGVILDETGVTALRKTAAKGFHTQESSGLDRRYVQVSKFQTLEELHLYCGALLTLLVDERDVH